MNIGLPELILIFIVIALIWGTEKLPELAKKLGDGFSAFCHENYADDKIKQIPESGAIEIGSIASTVATIGHQAQTNITVIHNHKESFDFGKYAHRMPLGVFISSDDNLSLERDMARKAIEGLGLSCHWLLELTTSSQRIHNITNEYIRNCDIYLMITEGNITDSMNAEHELARKSNISNRLYAMKDTTDLSGIERIWGKIEGNIGRFSNPDELQNVIRKWILPVIISRFHGGNRDNLDAQDLISLLKWGLTYKIADDFLQILREKIMLSFNSKDENLRLADLDGKTGRISQRLCLCPSRFRA